MTPYIFLGIAGVAVVAILAARASIARIRADHRNDSFWNEW